MQFTVRAGLAYDPRLDEMCRVFQSMMRTAYNRLLEGMSQREIDLYLLERYDVKNSRWRRSAVLRAKATIQSQRELLPMHVAEIEWKIQRVKRKLKQTANPLKHAGYDARIKKLERRKEQFETHTKHHTLPEVVFGGFRTLGSQAWRRKRRGQLLSVGEAGWRGNPNTQIRRAGDGFELEMRNWHGEKCFALPLDVSNHYRKVFEMLADGLLLPTWPVRRKYVVRAYTVQVMRRESSYACHVSFDAPDEPIQKWSSECLAALDVNPTHIDVAILNRHGNLVAAKSFKEDALIYARRNKRLWLASNLVERAFKWISFHGTGALIIEKLRFRGVEHGRTANRSISNFMHRKLLDLAAVKALKREWILVHVAAAYSSRIASAKYAPNFPRMNLHQLAAFVLGRRALGFKETVDSSQLKAIVRRVSLKRQAWVKAVFLHGHRHPYLMPHVSADGRMDYEDAKRRDALDERVTPRIRYAAQSPTVLERMQRLSWLMAPRGHGLRRVEAIRDDGWARAHRGSVPSPPRGSLGEDVNMTRVG